MDLEQLINQEMGYKLGDFYANLNRTESKKIARYIQQLREDGDDRLTDTEEQELARMLYFVDKIANLIQEKGMENVEPQYISMMSNYQNQILTALRKTRETGERPRSILDEIQDDLVEIGAKEGKIEIQFNED